MNVILITQGVSRLVTPLLSSDISVIGVVESMPRGYGKPKVESLIYKTLKFLYHKVKGSPETLKKLCEQRRIPYNYICKGRDDEVAEWVERLKPDLIVVYGMSQLIQQSLIDIPDFGVINLHPAYLPDYRGPNPDFWQYYNREMKPGVTVHYIDAGEDTGDIISQQRIHIPLGRKSPDMLNELIDDTGIPLLLEAISSINLGVAQRISQPQSSPTIRARNIKLDEHKKIIDWNNWETSHIWHVLRGTELWLNALEQPKGVYKGQRWEVGGYHFLKNQSNPPQTIYKLGRGFAVATNDGYIELKCKFSFKKMVLLLLMN